MAPSPMIETTLKSSFLWSLAWAIPRAEEIEVVEWPAPIASWTDSLRFRKPLIPSFCLNVLKLSLRPVKILCAYAWWPTSHTILSFGES